MITHASCPSSEVVYAKMSRFWDRISNFRLWVLGVGLQGLWGHEFQGSGLGFGA